MLGCRGRFFIWRKRGMRTMVITQLLERNARLYRDEIALVEVNPSHERDQAKTWREFGLIERSSPNAPYQVAFSSVMVPSMVAVSVQFSSVVCRSLSVSEVRLACSSWVSALSTWRLLEVAALSYACWACSSA